MSQKIKVSEKTVKRELAVLQEKGILTREGFELEVASFASILASFSSSGDKLVTRLVTNLGTRWGQGGDITAIFTANITAIICCIAWGNIHLNLECRYKINVEPCG